MRIPDRQLTLLEQRLATIGVSRRGFLRIVAGLAAAGPGFAPSARAGTPQLAPGEKLARDQVLRIGGGGYFAQDPLSHDFNKDIWCGGHPALFAGLVRFSADFLPVPHVASRLESNEDASVWTFYLRKDARWSNGAACTAHDFVWSWRRKLDPATGALHASFLYDIKNSRAFNNGQIKDSALLGVHAKDDHTLVVTLEGPRAYFPVLTGYLVGLPAYRPAVEKHGDKWTLPPNIVSNGPFVLESWDHHRQFVLKRNPYYFDAQHVRLERVVVPIIPLASGFLPYENNEVDFTLVPPGELTRALADPVLSKQVFRYPRPQTWYLTPQVTKPPFDNLRVRRAVSQAIDREAVAKVAQGVAIPAHSMVPPGLPGHIEDSRIRDRQRFDPKAALAALRGTPFEAGRNWPPIALTMREQGEGAKPMAEAIQAMLHEHLNMKTELVVLERRVFLERLWKHDFQLIWHRWSIDYPDPHNEYFDTFYGNTTAGRRQAWVSDQFDRLLEAAQGERDHPKRMALYRKAEEILQSEVAYVPVTWGTPYAALKPWVRGVPRNRFGDLVIDTNLYYHTLPQAYIVERA